MSQENAFAFLRKLEPDAFKNDFTQDPLLDTSKSETIVRAAADRGFEFSLQDLIAAQDANHQSNIPDHALEEVAGGFSRDIVVR
jgi:predicted ribosomally synthesized peptide with nif11-like leader